MKKQFVSILKLRKSKISNLTRLSNIIGGTDTIPPPTETNPSNTGSGTSETNCGSSNCETSMIPTDCQTNETTKSINDPTLFATGGFRNTTQVDC